MRITGPNGLTQRSCSAKGEYPSVLSLRERERERERERDRQTERQTDRQTDRQTQREREREYQATQYKVQGFLFIACKLAMNQTL